MRVLNDKERYEILSLKPDDITQKKLVELLAATSKGEARFNTNDLFALIANSRDVRDVYNKNTIETTVGKYIFNMFALPKAYLKKYGYNNEVMNASNLGKMETKMTDMMLIDELKPEDYIEYMRKGE